MFLEGPTGQLEALYESPDETVCPERAVVVCHPHPLYGGTMHSKVVYRLAKGLQKANSAVLRFNFRGVGRSSGTYDGGVGEQDDLRAALECLARHHPGLPLEVAGFSFGARVALGVSCRDTHIGRCLAVGTPVSHGGWDFLVRCSRPKFFLHSTNDEYGSRDTMEQIFARVAPPKTLLWIESSDHFFNGGLDELENAAYKAITADITPCA